VGGSVAVVVVNYRTPELTLGAVASLIAERERVPGLRAVVADGGSGDGSAEALAAAFAEPRFAGWTHFLPLSVNGGFGWANNQAIQWLMQGETPPDYLHLLNPDAEVEPGAVAALAAVLDAEPECGAVGSLLLEEDGTPTGSAFRFPGARSELVRGSRTDALGRLLGVGSLVMRPADLATVGWVTGASVMLRSEALRRTGLFDTGFFLYFEEVELMWRLTRGGWTVRHQPASRVRHLEGASTGVRDASGEMLAPPRPAYWYRSRRRLHALMLGGRGARVADLAWLAGDRLFALRRRLGLARGRVTVAGEAAGVRAGARAFDPPPAPARWDEPPGRPPAWMEG